MKIFEDFFDTINNLDNVDINLDNKVEDVEYNNKILVDINKKFDNSEEEFRIALRKLIYFLEFSNCFSNFRVSIFNKPQMFKNTSEVVV